MLCYQFNVTPFRLTGAPGAFCRAMNNCLCEFLFKCALVFVDDIIVWSPDLDSRKQDLSSVFSTYGTWFSVEAFRVLFLSEKN